MTDRELIAAEAAARKKAHDCPVYTGNEVRHAIRSGMRSAACSEEWMRLRNELNDRGLSPKDGA